MILVEMHRERVAAHTSRARSPFEVITRSLCSGEKLMMRFSPQKEIILVVFFANTFILISKDKKGVGS